MNILKTIKRKQLILIVKRLKCSFTIDKIKNLTHLKGIKSFEYKNMHKLKSQKPL